MSKCGQGQGGGAGDGLGEIWFAMHLGRSCSRGDFERLGTRLGQGRGAAAAAAAVWRMLTCTSAWPLQKWSIAIT